MFMIWLFKGGDRRKRQNVLLTFTDGRAWPRRRIKPFSLTVPPLRVSNMSTICLVCSFVYFEFPIQAPVLLIFFVVFVSFVVVFFFTFDFLIRLSGCRFGANSV